MQTLGHLGKRAFPSAYSRYIRWQYRRVSLAKRVEAILCSDESPSYYDDEFEALQNSYTRWWGDYEYDGYSTWARGFERALKLMAVPDLRALDLQVFEAGCGDGMTSYALASYDNARQVTLNDTDDWRDSRAKPFPFIAGDVCSRLPLDGDSFDLVLTYNTFEHFEDPQAALTELTTLCKKGGYIYIEFDPLYCSPLGLHAFSFLMPYPQFLFSPSFIERKVKELGVDDLGKESGGLQSTNRWRVAQFRELWRSSGCEIVSLKERAEPRHLSIVTQFSKAFCGRGLTVDDLVVHRTSVLLRKK